MTDDPQADERLKRYLADLVATASPVQRLLLLFDYLRRDLTKADEGFSGRDWKVVNDSLVHAQHIMFALRDPLDQGTELGRSLAGVYGFCLAQLLKCNLEKDPSLLPPVRSIVDQLASTNATAAASLNAERQSA